MNKESYENYMLLLADTVSRRQTDPEAPADLETLQDIIETAVLNYEEQRGIERNRGEIAEALAELLNTIYPALSQIYADLLINLLPAMHQDKARKILINSYELMGMLSRYAATDARIKASATEE